MKNTLLTIITGALGAGIALAAAAHADEPFTRCPDGQTGVAEGHTSCEFAHNVFRAYVDQGGPIVTAYSPVTAETYEMQCQPGFISHLNDGETVTSVRCVGGDDAVVIFW